MEKQRAPICREKLIELNIKEHNVLYFKVTTTICISLIPLPEELKKFNTVYEEPTVKTKTSHVLYPDDLRLKSEKETELQT